VSEGDAGLPVPRQLPPDVVPFTNREVYLAGLRAWLDTPYEFAAPAAVIAGIGGVGKTSLAAHWAHQVRHRFPDGDLYVDLRGYHVERSVGAEEALDHLLRALDVPWERIPPGLDPKSALYRSLLHGRHVLVILDNAATVEQVRPLLPGSATCRVLVTTRSQLSGLATREGAHRMPLDVLPPDRAVELLEQICGVDRLRGEAAATAELARYCDYLPLALRIVAERLVASRHLTVAEVVAELAQAQERLDVLAGEDEVTTVRAVFSWSYHALSPDAARMFRLLGLPTGPDISTAAAAVLADLPEPAARRTLDKLVGAHLLQEVGPHRYRFHDLLRVYAAECAQADESAEEREAATYRLLLWYTLSAAGATKVIAPHLSSIPLDLPKPGRLPLTFPDRLTALHWCDAEHANLVATVDHAADIGEHTLAWQLPVIALGFFLVRRPFTEWIATHHTGLAAARRLGERTAEAWLHTSIAIAHRELGQHDLALDNLRSALSVWRELGPRWAQAWTLRDLGRIYHLLDRDAEAIEILREALALHIADGDTWGEAVALSILGLAHRDLGQLDEALDDLNRALDIYRSHDDQRNVAAGLSNLALVHHSLGRTDRAIDHLNEALTGHRTVDNWHGEAQAHERLGTVLNDAGQPEPARRHWRAAVELYDKIGDPRAGDVRSWLTA
jgi:tetratricopeptide (TPR) repeat protein